MERILDPRPRVRAWRRLASKAALLVVLLLLAGSATACGGGGGDGGGDEDESEGGGGPSPGGSVGGVVVLAANDLGMHCMDQEFSTFMILPPYNVVRAQALRRTSTGPRLLGPVDVDLTYEAVADARGSRNGRSRGKTDFWTHVGALLGVSLPEGQGLQGLFMPDDAPLPGPQAMPWNTRAGLWAAEGIPITPQDDAGVTNTYPLLRVSARERAGGARLAALDVVVPVAQETDCRSCHRTGGLGSTRSGVAWSADGDPERQAKENVLRLHDAAHGTSLSATKPVLCAACHYSAALDLAGTGPQGPQVGRPSFSQALHARHAFLTGDADASCYRCHPGAITRCARGVMADAGLECRDCHGDMAAVAGLSPLRVGGSMDGRNDGGARRPWMDLPRCQSCHTGDALTRLTGTDLVLAADGLRLRQAWRLGDPAASPIRQPSSRFAEAPGTSYRFSTGHGGLLCQACHGSTHAEWRVGDPAANDNVAATQLQGHAGTLMECGTCHAAGTLGITTAGPHGLHNVGDPRFVDEVHGELYERNPAACQACHGAALGGTPLSKVSSERTFWVEGRRITLLQGEQVGCTRCHGRP